MTQPRTIDEILIQLQMATLYAENTEPGTTIARNEAKQAMLDLILSVPDLRFDNVSEPTQSGTVATRNILRRLIRIDIQQLFSDSASK